MLAHNRVKKLTSFVVVLAMLNTMALSCSGGGGGGGDDSNSNPSITISTIGVEGVADNNDAGESGMTVMSVYKGTASPIISSAFSTTVSTFGTQLLLVHDANKNLKGLTLSVIDPSTKQASVLPIGTETTALTMLMLTPLITTTNPEETQNRLLELKKLAAFQGLVDYLRVQLALKPLTEVVKEATCKSLLDSCLEEWVASKSRVVPSSIGIVTSSDGDFFIDKIDNSDQVHTKVPLVNFGLRYVNVYRRAMNQNGDEIDLKLIVNPMAGMETASLGSLVTGTTGTTTQFVDTVDSSPAAGVARFEYWIVGPGLKPLTVQNVPPGVSSVDAGAAYNYTAAKYILLPAIGIIFGGLDIPVSKQLGALLEAIIFIPEASKDLLEFQRASTASEGLSALTNLFSDLASKEFFIVLLERMGVKASVVSIAAPLAATAMGTVGAGISTGNLVGFAYWTGKLPRIAMARADVLKISKPGIVTLTPANGTWQSSPQYLTASSTGATAVYYRLNAKTDGTTPVDPVDPTASSNDGSASGLIIQLYGNAGEKKNIKLKVVGCNSSGCGPVSQVYSYTIDQTAAAQSCPSGNGLYCGNVGLGQDVDWLYQCTSGSYTVSKECGSGCQNNGVGINDSCITQPTVNPAIAQSPPSGSPGTVFTQWGTGFTPNSTAILYFPKYDGINDGTSQVNMDSQGHFEITYPSGVNKPSGNYQWWAIDGPTGTKSNTVTYSIVANHMYEGWIDDADCSSFWGWAWDASKPSTPISVDLYDGSTKLSTVAANVFRQDLVNAGKGNGYHGFSYVTPSSLKDGKEHSLYAKYSDTNTNLSGSPKTFICSGYASVSQGVTVSQNPVVLGQNFTISFSLKERRGASKTFENIAVAILDPGGTFVFDFAMFPAVTIAAYGTKNYSAQNYIYTSRPSGTYKAVIRGKVGGQWFDFDTVDSGETPKSFSVVH